MKNSTLHKKNPPSSLVDSLDFIHPPLLVFKSYALVFSTKSHPPRLFQPPRLVIWHICAPSTFIPTSTFSNLAYFPPPPRLLERVDPRMPNQCVKGNFDTLKKRQKSQNSYFQHKLWFPYISISIWTSLIFIDVFFVCKIKSYSKRDLWALNYEHWFNKKILTFIHFSKSLFPKIYRLWWLLKTSNFTQHSEQACKNLPNFTCLSWNLHNHQNSNQEMLSSRKDKIYIMSNYKKNCAP